MPTVFLSYSREDLHLIEQLEAKLRSHPEIAIWQDQEEIYGGQKCPKSGEVNLIRSRLRVPVRLPLSPHETTSLSR